MEKEMNYLSERIESIEQRTDMMIRHSKDPNKKHLWSTHEIMIKEMNDEKQLLEDTLGFVTNCNNLVEIENVHLEDSDDVKNEGGIYYVDGRVQSAYITKQDFDQIKCITN